MDELMVAVPDDMANTPGMLMIPPLAVSVVLVKFVASAFSASVLALNTMSNLPVPVPDERMLALILTLPVAFSVAMASLPAVLDIPLPASVRSPPFAVSVMLCIAPRVWVPMVNAPALFSDTS